MTAESPVAVTLERLTEAAAKPADNVEVLRSLVARLHGKIKAQDAESRQEVLSMVSASQHQGVEQLVKIMELCRDPMLVAGVCALLHDLLSPSHKEQRQGVLQKCLALNTAEVIFRTLKALSTDGLGAIDVCIHPAYQVLAKLASKEPKLAIKARLVGGVKLTHQLLQAHSKNSIPLLPLLMVAKYLAKNSTNQMMLGKEGCVATLATILSSVPKTHWAKIKFIMEVLALLTKAKSNVIRLVRESGLQRVLATLDGWEKVERRHQVKLIRGILSTLSHVCDSKHGRKAVISLNGVEIVQRFIQMCPADKKYDSNLANATNVFLKCVTKGELPVASVRGAFTFQVPNRDASPAPSDVQMDSSGMGMDVDTSEDEAEYDVEAEEEEMELQKDFKGLNITQEYCPTLPRIDELQKLAHLFPELDDFQVQNGTKFADSVLSSREGSFKEGMSESGTEHYLLASDTTRSLISFVKAAYPDLVGAQGPPHLEELYEKDRKVCRNKAIATVERVLHPEVYMERVVYDLDYLLESEHSLSHPLITPSTTTTTTTTLRPLSNLDEKRVGKKDMAVNHLNFESRFESGNLRRAIQASKTEYDLILNADVNSAHHYQWFYFEVSNMEANTPYIFNIINNEKPNSEFNFGMKPVMFSVQEASEGRAMWVRTGYDICYHKNHFSRIPKSHDTTRSKRQAANACYYTATFTVVFPHSHDICYIAYHYPYTYTRLKAYLSRQEAKELPSHVFYSSQLLCHTLNGNPVPLLTITSKDNIKDKEVIFLTARVHPGESNASWVMEGVLNQLLKESSTSRYLLDKFIFKIVPMLNPEGVIHGNHRCGLTDEDLNRRWREPNPTLHPTIYHAKALLEYLRSVAKVKVRVFCDFHGHSCQKNVFMYGCSYQQSWWPGDREVQDDPDYRLLPHLAQACMRTFSLWDCHFLIERAREATARVAVWRQFNIPMSYTMEASTCGCDQGPYKNNHLSTKQLLESGEELCGALAYLASGPVERPDQLKVDIRRPDSESRVTSERSLGDFSHEVVFWSSDLDEDELDSDADLDLDLYGTV
ncbi:cytosolic carboxypeptidase 1-like isoform X2 [Eriocheir sinensis]|uniref:cytosolic carboxypeptidase 1-like isoform X2 n=1 Tax=Eriocheir sinensis TaxID=95602 RepID=UPI0021C9E64E|nr:cytosolic carboxypeptidase 1-like isoform X2 [Eriocheir sinensis]